MAENVRSDKCSYALKTSNYQINYLYMLSWRILPEQKEDSLLLKLGKETLAIHSTGQNFSLTSRNSEAIVKKFSDYISERIFNTRFQVYILNYAGLRKLCQNGQCQDCQHCIARLVLTRQTIYSKSKICIIAY